MMLFYIMLTHAIGILAWFSVWWQGKCKGAVRLLASDFLLFRRGNDNIILKDWG